MYIYVYICINVYIVTDLPPRAFRAALLCADPPGCRSEQTAAGRGGGREQARVLCACRHALVPRAGGNTQHAMCRPSVHRAPLTMQHAQRATQDMSGVHAAQPHQYAVNQLVPRVACCMSQGASCMYVVCRMVHPVCMLYVAGCIM